MDRVVKIEEPYSFKPTIFCKHCGNTNNMLWLTFQPCTECGEIDSIDVTARLLRVTTSLGNSKWVYQFHHTMDEKVQAAYNVANKIEVPFHTKTGDGIFYSVTVNKNHLLAEMKTYDALWNQPLGMSGESDSNILDNSTKCKLIPKVSAVDKHIKEKSFFQKLFEMFKSEPK
jgi:hypothetical protein